jgi:hypothetical protein
MSFRKELAGVMKKSEFKKIIPVIKKFSPGKLDIKGFNSVLSGLSNLTEDDGFVSNEVFDVIALVHSDEHYTETTYTAFIKLYSGKVCFNLDNVFNFLGHMKANKFRIKRRTMAPIFEMCSREELYVEACQFYAESKALDILLEPVDYINLLDTPYEYFKKTILQDMADNISIFSEEDIEMISEVFLLNTELVIDTDNIVRSDSEDFNINYHIPTFELNQGEKKGIKESFILFVNKFFGRNSKKFSDFIKTVSKMNYNLVIDGANVGFFKKGKDSGKKLDYTQIKSFIVEAISNGYNPLLILHSRHNNESQELRDILKECPNHFFTPKGMDDDIFWLYASLMKNGCHLLTNDELRNHLFYMNLGDRFLEWKKYNRMTYDLHNRRDIVFNIPKKHMERVIYDYVNNGLYVPYKNMSLGNVEWKYFRTG